MHLSPCPVSNRSPHPQSTHGVPRNVDELSSLQSSADASSGRPGARVPTEPPATSMAARGSSLPSSRWSRPEAHRRAEARPRLRNTGWTCQECQEWVPDRENYVSHMKKSHGRVSSHMVTVHICWTSVHWGQSALVPGALGRTGIIDLEVFGASSFLPPSSEWTHVPRAVLQF